MSNKPNSGEKSHHLLLRKSPITSYSGKVPTTSYWDKSPLKPNGKSPNYREMVSRDWETRLESESQLMGNDSLGLGL